MWTISNKDEKSFLSGIIDSRGFVHSDTEALARAFGDCPENNENIKEFMIDLSTQEGTPQIEALGIGRHRRILDDIIRGLSKSEILSTESKAALKNILYRSENSYRTSMRFLKYLTKEKIEKSSRFFEISIPFDRIVDGLSDFIEAGHYDHNSVKFDTQIELFEMSLKYNFVDQYEKPEKERYMKHTYDTYASYLKDGIKYLEVNLTKLEKKQTLEKLDLLIELGHYSIKEIENLKKVRTLVKHANLLIQE